MSYLFFRAKKAISIIGNAKYNDHTSELLHNLNILTMFQLVKLQTCIVHLVANCHMIYSHILPKAFLEMNIEPDNKIVSSKNIFEQLNGIIFYLILGL